jgi:hypothetical protein
MSEYRYIAIGFADGASVISSPLELVTTTEAKRWGRSLDLAWIQLYPADVPTNHIRYERDAERAEGYRVGCSKATAEFLSPELAAEAAIGRAA